MARGGLGLWTSAVYGGRECAWGKFILRGCVVCWVVRGLGHARNYVPSKISSSCLLGILVCLCVFEWS